MGRKPIGKVAMTAAERQRRRRAKLRLGRPYAALERTWAACSKAERTRFLRSLRAASLQRKKERRAEMERAWAERIIRENDARAVGWLGALPIVSGATPATPYRRPRRGSPSGGD